MVECFCFGSATFVAAATFAMRTTAKHSPLTNTNKVNDDAGNLQYVCVRTWIVYWLAKFLPSFHTEVFLVCFCCRIYFITYVNCKQTITNTNARCSHSHNRFTLKSTTATVAAFAQGSVRFCFGLDWARDSILCHCTCSWYRRYSLFDAFVAVVLLLLLLLGNV